MSSRAAVMVATIDARRWSWLLLGLALASRLVWVALSPAVLASDSAYYDHAAQDLTAGKGYIMDGRPTAYWPVGYPAFLALVYMAVGHSTTTVKLIQALLGALTVVLVYRLTVRAYDEAAGRLAGLLLALSPNDSSYAAVLLSEIVFTTLFLGGLLLLVWFRQAGWPAAAYVLVGVAFGLASYVRPVALLLPIFLAVWSFVHDPERIRAVRTYALVIVALGLTLLPWTIRNWVVLGYPVVVSTNGGVNLLLGNHPGGTGAYHLFESRSVLTVWGDEVARERAAVREAVGFIRASPRHFLWLCAKRLFFLLAIGWDGIYANFRETAASVHSGARYVLYALAQVYYLVVLSLCGLKLLRSTRLQREEGLLVGVVVYWLAVHAIIVGVPRHRFPVMPLFAAFAGAYLVQRPVARWMER